MEKIVNSPGLQHLAEKVFSNLDVEDLKICGQINQSCKQILENPMFWLKKFTSLSKENLKDWIKVIKPEKNSDKQKHIISYLQWNLKKGAVNIPCYSSSSIQDVLWSEILSCCTKSSPSNENTEVVNILAPLTDNPNAPDEDGKTPIYWAALNGHTDIIKILTPMTSNPNFSTVYGVTPIRNAARKGHTEIVQILASLTDNVNVPSNLGFTPIFWAAFYGHIEVIKVLAPLTENANSPNNSRETPIYWAAKHGHTEIVKFLASLTDNPNAPREDGTTPIYCAAENGHIEIVKILASSTDNPNAPNRYGITPSKVTNNSEIQRFLENVETSRKRKAGSSIKPSKKQARKF